jgi:hypothetical protein
VSEPEREPRHTVILAVVVDFEGDYYGTDELVGMCDQWIGSAFDDRDNLRGYKLTGVARREPDTHEDD